jgi:malate synthase
VVAEQAGLANFVIDTAAGPTTLKDPSAFAAYGQQGERAEIVLRHNGLHVILVVDKTHPIGISQVSGLADVIVESALTTIQDCEDSVAAVDAEDKVDVYRNWLGLMNGTLEETFEKRGRTISRKLRPDKTYTDPNGKPLTLKGRALLLVRNVGHLMTTNAVLDGAGKPIGEGLMDAAVPARCALSAKGHRRPGAI